MKQDFNVGGSPNTDEDRRGYRLAWLILSVVLFGALMAFRGELHSIWQRAFVAGTAGAVFVTAVRAFRHKQ